MEKVKRVGQKTPLQPLSRQKQQDFIGQRSVMVAGYNQERLSSFNILGRAMSLLLGAQTHLQPPLLCGSLLPGRN